ncbi:MAG: branched-chain amino acid ABC transporter permease [bacterium]
MATLFQTLILGLLVGGVYALLASGLTVIFGVMRIINIAHGALMIIGAFITYTLWRYAGLDPFIGVVITMIAMYAIGWVLYFVTVRPVRRAPVTSSVLLTFGLAFFLEGVMGFIWGNNAVASRPGYVETSFHLGAFYVPKGLLFGCLLAIVIMVALQLVFSRTWLGRSIRASASSEDAARLVGVNIPMVAAITFALGAASAGAGGAIISIMGTFVAGSQILWITRMLSVVVLGGLGSVPGAVLAALILGVGESLVATYVSPLWSPALSIILIFVILVVRPQGLLGTKLREDVAQ